MRKTRRGVGAAVALLLLLPLTMAPKIADVSAAGLHISGQISQDEVRAGGVVTIVLTAKNITDEQIDSRHVTVALSGIAPGSLEVVHLSSTCGPGNDDREFGCGVGPLEAGKSTRLVLTLRSTVSGFITVRAFVADLS